eukprot:CAMPEP_0202866914 /NCGR_PEP_ID=MMETSP1391-20130828/8427_1 /ASSEMBLY_ACC=CAM_ASM_000867 /TAXON_ID=1034604 /ORGANISM="Chlamydomonas leiostraca, Strain SAG 11-49" /LENGTH=195 /DNA_ID=CAMNT_0049546903 /DNA_START=128 /DNA_END=716 /DNA_ORIENTATION=-
MCQKTATSVPNIAVAAEAAQQAESEEERVLRVRAECTRRIKQLGAKGRMRDAIQELASLGEVGVQPDTLAATALVRACCRDMELAQSIFDELFGDFLTPDEVTFSVLLRGYGGLNPPDWVRIDSTLTTMRTKFNITPTATSYNALLEVCARTNDLERGEDVVDRMANDGVEPNEFTEAAVAARRSLRSYVRKVLL